MSDKLLLSNPLELTTLLVRHHGIHQGLWTLTVNFEVHGRTFVPDLAPSAGMPAAVVCVDTVGIRQVEVADGLTVDAAVVNPTATTGEKASSKPQKVARKAAKKRP